jgi:Skp family chaperone for outer membrane proteins
MKKNFFVFTIFIFITLLNFNLLKAQDNIAFIDLNIVFDNSNAGKKVNKEIQDKKKKNNKNFKDLKNKFKTDREKLINQKNVLSKE